MNVKLLNFVRYATADELADKLFLMAEKHPETFTSLFVDTDVEVLVPITLQRVKFTKSEWDEIQAYVREHKITCIKRIREITRIGLKEAKDLCETFPNMKPFSTY